MLPTTFYGNQKQPLIFIGFSKTVVFLVAAYVGFRIDRWEWGRVQKTVDLEPKGPINH